MASSDWTAQIRRILQAAIRAGLLSALRNLVGGRSTGGPGSRTGSTSGRSARSTARRTTRKRAAKAPASAAKAPAPGAKAPAPAAPRRAAKRAAKAPAGTMIGGHLVLDDYEGVPEPEYTPQDDGLPDPGEIVWSWVAFEEDRSQGKDRPLLVIGRDGAALLGLMLTSKDHDRDAAQEARYGRHWIDIGTGDWDPQRRPSEIRVDRVLRIDPGAVRREGAVLDRTRFDQVAREVTRVARAG